MGSSRVFSHTRRAMDAAEEHLIPRRITSRFTAEDNPRLRRDRLNIIPWLDGTRTLDETRILEVGCGDGYSTIALAEQGAAVLGLDVNSVDGAAHRCEALGLQADFVVANAKDLNVVVDAPLDWVIFWASLEHMTIPERLAAITAAWTVLGDGGLLTVIETPNRLWFDDSHTSLMPYFNWLPDELAFRYSQHSPRGGFNDRYRHLDDESLLAFLRRGRGVSFHEFDLAIGGANLDVVGCMQLHRRARNPVRAVGWRASRAGRYEQLLRSVTPQVPRAFLQPFLYLTLRKTAA